MEQLHDGVVNLLQSNTHGGPAFVGCLHELALSESASTQSDLKWIPPSTVFNSARHSSNYHSGILILEKQLLSSNKLQTAFKMFDKDGGGSISTDEIKQVLSFGQNLDEDVIQMIIKQVDENGDGEISYDEFAAMMLKNIQD